MENTAKRYQGGEKKPRFQQRPATPPINWAGGAMLVAAIALTGAMLHGAADFFSPAAPEASAEATSALDVLSEARF